MSTSGGARLPLDHARCTNRACWVRARCLRGVVFDREAAAPDGRRVSMQWFPGGAECPGLVRTGNGR